MYRIFNASSRWQFKFQKLIANIVLFACDLFFILYRYYNGEKWNGWIYKFLYKN